MLIIIIHIRLRQRKDKFRAHALRADDIDILTMGADDLLGDGEAESGAFLIFAAGQVGFIEAVPDQLQVVLRDADTRIFYADEDFIVFFG